MPNTNQIPPLMSVSVGGVVPSKSQSGLVSVRFKSSKEILEIPFKGAYISVADVRKGISQWKRLSTSSSADYELEISNELTGHVYVTDHTLIPPDTKLTVVRVPSRSVEVEPEAEVPESQLGTDCNYGLWRRTSNDSGIGTQEDFNSSLPTGSSGPFVLNPLFYPGARRQLDGSGTSGNSNTQTTPAYMHSYQIPRDPSTHDSRIRTISTTSSSGPTVDDYDLDNDIFGLSASTRQKPKRNKAKKRKASRSPCPSPEPPAPVVLSADVPGPGYICYYCRKPGHFIKDCPAKLGNFPQFKRSTGIPRSQLVVVNGPQRGSMISPEGRHVVPIVDLTTDD